jgi:hypothetical protein
MYWEGMCVCVSRRRRGQAKGAAGRPLRYQQQRSAMMMHDDACLSDLTAGPGARHPLFTTRARTHTGVHAQPVGTKGSRSCSCVLDGPGRL